MSTAVAAKEINSEPAQPRRLEKKRNIRPRLLPARRHLKPGFAIPIRLFRKAN